MSITDGSVTCALCGEWRTSCSLCIGEEKTINHNLVVLAREEREAERELWLQEKSIRDAEEARREL